ncbi:MAG: urease accessory protein UreD [Rikenellaceae bacterium]|nr:urease accessory protein UreD [Rikenellaceae bacterium]
MMSDLSAIRELKPYGADPPAMAAGGAGKCGLLRLGFERDPKGRTLLKRWERHAPLIAQQALYFDEQLPGMACLYILSAGGPEVDGDRYLTEVDVGPEGELFLSTGAATKVATMRHNFSAVEQRFRLDKGAYMEYLPEPLIPCRNSRRWSTTELTIDPTATLFYGECCLAGRHRHHDERFRYDLLALNLSVRRPSGRELMREKILLEPARHSPASPGVLGRYEVFASALILTPKEARDTLFQKIGPRVGLFEEYGLGLLRLPNDAGLQCRILSRRGETAKGLLRELCSCVRQTIKGVPMPEEFPWR